MEVFYDCEIPKHLTIDHIDRNIYNNSLENLRFATQAEQHENRKNTKFTENEIKSLGSQSNNYRIELAKRNGFKTYADYLYSLQAGVLIFIISLIRPRPCWSA